MRRRNDISVHLAAWPGRQQPFAWLLPQALAVLPMLIILLLGLPMVVWSPVVLAADAPPSRAGVICTQQYVPVCAERQGRHITYANACFARAAGARIIASGVCEQLQGATGRRKGCATAGKGAADAADPAADATCRSWTDGCNICRRSAPGAPAACTRMACARKAAARCLLRFGEK